MYTNEKIYSIELGEDLETKTPPKEPQVTSPLRKTRTRLTRQARSSMRSNPRAGSKPPSGGLQFAPLMILTYLLGPFSVHLDPGNRGRFGLLTAGMLSGMAGLGMFAGRGFLLDIMGKGMPLWPWAVAGVAVLLTAFSVWARAAYLVVSRHGLPQHKLPSLLRKPWAVGIMGLFAPGLGLLLSGCARRGAAVIWMAWPVAAAVLLLANGLQFWNLNQTAQGATIPPGILEVSLMISAGILAAGLIGWIAQALEGARQMMGEPGIRHRMKGDWYAAALLFTMMGLAVIWNPVTAARQLDNAGIILKEKEFQVIPLYLARAAHHLDPGPSEYAVRAMALYEELGRRDEAMGLRRELDQNLASYLALVQADNQSQVTGSIAGGSSEQDWKLVGDLLGQPDPHWVYRPSYQAR